MCNGVLKFFVLESIVAPYSINISTKGAWPSLAATCNGVHPSVFVQLIILIYDTYGGNAYSTLRIASLSPTSTAIHNLRAMSLIVFLIKLSVLTGFSIYFWLAYC